MAYTATAPLRSNAPASVDAAVNSLSARPQGSKTLAAVLLAATMSALLVLADQVIDTWTDGNLLAAWVALWTVTFAALAFLSRPLRQLASQVAGAYAVWAEAQRVRRLEESMWEYARHDRRVMDELQAAYNRQH